MKENCGDGHSVRNYTTTKAHKCRAHQAIRQNANKRRQVRTQQKMPYQPKVHYNKFETEQQETEEIVISRTQ